MVYSRYLLVPVAAGMLALSALAGCGGQDAGADASQRSAPLLEPCTTISADEVGSLLGYKVSSMTTPERACVFEPVGNSHGTSVRVSAGVSAAPGGIDGAKAGTLAEIDGDPETLPGIGDAAYVVTGKGKAAGSGKLQAQAAVQLKGQLVTITLTRPGDGAPAELTRLATGALRLVASKV